MIKKLVIVLAFCIPVFCLAQNTTEEKLTIGEPAIDFTLNDINENPVTLSGLKGKVVVLDFWASWCKWCRVEYPAMLKMYDKYKSEGLEIVGISLDFKKDEWLAAVEKDKLTWINLSNVMGAHCPVVKAYGVRAIPVTVIIDREGNVRAINLHGEELEKEVARLINE